jgi:hypothetical protein
MAASRQHQDARDRSCDATVYQLAEHVREHGGFFSVPFALRQGERFRALPYSARFVAFHLYAVMHRVSSPRFRASERTLAREFGMDAKTLRKAFGAIEDAQLLRRTPGKSASVPTEYWLLNPGTHCEFPVVENRGIPTFTGFSSPRGKRTKTISDGDHDSGVAFAAQTPPAESALNPAATVDKPEFSMRTGDFERGVCSLHGHTAINHRPDGSALCGDCHPTGITEPPRKTVAQPTAQELFGDSWHSR